MDLVRDDRGNFDLLGHSFERDQAKLADGESKLDCIDQVSRGENLTCCGERTDPGRGVNAFAAVVPPLLGGFRTV